MNVHFFSFPSFSLGTAFIVEAPASTRAQKALRREAGASQANVFPSFGLGTRTGEAKEIEHFCLDGDLETLR